MKFVGSSKNSEQWRQLEDKFHTVTDALGKEIDPGIFETVVALNALGVNTVGSCEGHLEHGTGAPYLDIETPSTDAASEKLRRGNGIQKTPSERTPTRQQLQDFVNVPNDPETIRAEITNENLEQRRKLMSYLDEFYEGRVVPFDRRITLQAKALGTTRMESQGVDLQKLNTPEMRQQKLAEYQEEMQLFGRFLKEKFLSK